MSAMNHAAFDDGRPLEDETLRHFVPSVFAAEPHWSRSEKFVQVPTIDVLHELGSYGWNPVWAAQSKTRTPERADFTRHLIRLRHQDLKTYQIDEQPLEIVLRNASDGTASYELFMGLFRFACENGLIFMDHRTNMVHVRHVGNAAKEVVKGSKELLAHTATVSEAVARWRNIELNHEQRMKLAVKARDLRFGKDSVISADQMIVPRRPGDMSHDLWTTFNVVQENVMKGGLTGRLPANDNRRSRQTSSRPITAVDANVHLNRELWNIASLTYRELTRAAA